MLNFDNTSKTVKQLEAEADSLFDQFLKEYEKTEVGD